MAHGPRCWEAKAPLRVCWPVGRRAPAPSEVSLLLTFAVLHVSLITSDGLTLPDTGGSHLPTVFIRRETALWNWLLSHDPKLGLGSLSRSRSPTHPPVQ